MGGEKISRINRSLPCVLNIQNRLLPSGACQPIAAQKQDQAGESCESCASYNQGQCPRSARHSLIHRSQSSHDIALADTACGHLFAVFGNLAVF